MILLAILIVVFGIVLIGTLLDIPILLQIHREAPPEEATHYTELRWSHAAAAALAVMLGISATVGDSMLAHSLTTLYLLVALKESMLFAMFRKGHDKLKVAQTDEEQQ